MQSCRGMFNKEAISKMKRGSFIVNNARGSVVEEDAIAEALKSGQLGGAIPPCPAAAQAST